MNQSKVPRSFGTHDGSFHADEVTACALLLVFGKIEKDNILRTRELEVLSRCEYVCDVGGVYSPEEKLFDHHQQDYQGPLSSAGMILTYLFESGAIDQKEQDFFENSIILGVDAHDNGKELHSKGVCTYSHIVSNFNPVTYDSDAKMQDRAFFEALDFAVSYLLKLRQRYAYTHSCQEVVAEAMKKGKEFLFFEKSIPWQEIFFEMNGAKHPANFVVMPSGQHWKLRGIPPTLEEKMKVRFPLPKEWAGLIGEDLKKISGIQGAVFCHKGRFISVWETKEDALKAMEMALKSNR